MILFLYINYSCKESSYQRTRVGQSPKIFDSESNNVRVRVPFWDALVESASTNTRILSSPNPPVGCSSPIERVDESSNLINFF